MAMSQYSFNDGAAYERMMGTWSRLAGEIFLDWLAPPRGLRWIDVGCGNGAFSDLIVDRCAPSGVEGIDPSEGQLAFARARLSAQLAKFQQGDAMALPFADNSFDAATMALVIFFVPDPVKGVAEMARVVRPGGLIATYAWDMLGGGFPIEPIQAELRAMSIEPLRPPSPEASRTDDLRVLWSGAGIGEIDTKVITVQRTFNDFEEFWSIAMLSSLKNVVGTMAAGDVEMLKSRVRARMPADPTGRITASAWANAIKGQLAK
jgi:ubiquinone/menaquinone biosynthesis C-methylase UbiE